MITASLVKELREKTGAGMMDCKKALEETNGNIDEAVDWLREKGISKENIRSAFENSSENYDDIQEEELIKKLLLKKNYNFSMSSVKEQQKIIAFLYRKGFSLDKIYKVVEQID